MDLLRGSRVEPRSDAADVRASPSTTTPLFTKRRTAVLGCTASAGLFQWCDLTTMLASPSVGATIYGNCLSNTLVA